jgi:hypothetical protein
MSAKLLYKIARRLCDTQEPEKVGLMLTFLEKTPKDSALILRSTLDGLIEGQRGKVTLPAEMKPEVLAELMKHSDKEVASRAQRLGALWGDPGALRASIAVLDEIISAGRATRRDRPIASPNQSLAGIFDDDSRGFPEADVQIPMNAWLSKRFAAFGEVGGAGRAECAAGELAEVLARQTARRPRKS